MLGHKPTNVLVHILIGARVSDEYIDAVDEFMNAVQTRYPNALVQFEDFSSDKAQFILDRYRERHLCFNDDIQGTGATSLAGILSALRIKGKKPADLQDERILVVGAGSAGTGVAQALLDGMVEGAGEMTTDDARRRFCMARPFDSSIRRFVASFYRASLLSAIGRPAFHSHGLDFQDF